MTGLTLQGGHLPDGRVVDVRMEDGYLVEVSEPGRRSAGPAIDLAGYLLLPAPAEAHSHFDKVLTAGLLSNEAGDLAGAVDAWYGYRQRASCSEIVERASRACRLMLDRGVTAIRTHIDVGCSIGLRFVCALHEVRAEYADLLDLELVAFVDEPTTGRAGALNRELLREALAAGVDTVGGAPYRDPDPIKCQRFLLETAAESGARVDLHTDEVLDPGVSSLRSLAADTVALELTGVTASHCLSLGLLSPDQVDRIADELAEAGVAVVTAPATNLYLQGRDRPALRGLAPVRTLLERGVTVAGGGDNIQDPFNPLGSGDPLETAALLVLAAHLDPEQAYRAVSGAARTIQGLPAVEMMAGSPAEILAIRAHDLRSAIAMRSPDRVVIHQGRVVAGPADRRFPVRTGATVGLR